MALSAGVRLGAYEVVSLIGSGGMGEVYRARDTKLNRDVAIKVLPDAVATDPERLARFHREAQVLASLNHQNIAHIYGVEDSSSTHALVMELVEGPTLADRIGHGPIPLDESLAIAKQIAEALEFAHEQGIIHRDLKPANIKVRDDGTVKVLDFGLAKLVEPGGAAQSGPHALVTASPTLTTPAMMTGVGVILGTAAYMSPEQAKGKPADKRSDIWAFGCVLYEMLTGKRTFEGEDVGDTLAAVLMREPDLAALPVTVPPPIRTLLRRCLERDRARRIASISTASFLLLESTTSTPLPRAQAAAARSATRFSKLWPVLATVFLVATVALGGVVTYLVLSEAGATTVRFFVAPPDKNVFDLSGGGTGFTQGAGAGTVSPDGRYLAFALRDVGGKVLLWIRPLDSLAAQALPGTEGATYPFWSPDSHFLAFQANGKLKKIDVTGGPPLPLCELTSLRGGSWNRDGVIVFAPAADGPLFRVSAAGGQPVALTKLQTGQTSHRRPVFLPDGRHFLYRVYGTSPGIVVGSLDSDATTAVPVAADAQALYTPPGFLLFTRQGTLLAQSFDARSLQLSGEAMPIAEQIATDTGNGLAAFSVSDTGVLTYRAGGQEAPIQLSWFDRSGRQSVVAGLPPGDYRGIDVSRDGKRIALHTHTANGGDIYVFDTERRTNQRFTFDENRHYSFPLWSPDGSRLAYAATLGKTAIFQKLSSGGSDDELLVETEALSTVSAGPQAWSRDGRLMLYGRTNPKTQRDVWAFPFDGRKPFPVLSGEFSEDHAALSADGRWLAYQSNESRGVEIIVQTFPPAGGKWQISSGGGRQPLWRQDGKELYYVSADNKLMSVDVRVDGATLSWGASKELFDPHINALLTLSNTYRSYAVIDNGQRFLVASDALKNVQDTSQITVVLNWTAGLRR